MKKRTLAVLLSAVMLMGLVFPAYAEDNIEVPDAEQTISDNNDVNGIESSEEAETQLEENVTDEESEEQGALIKVNPLGDPSKNGFVDEDGDTYYYEYGNRVTGWKSVDGRWYYFGDDGKMVTGFFDNTRAVYYLQTAEECPEYPGSMLKGWKNDQYGNHLYYFRPEKDAKGVEGSLVTGWQQIDNAWYYFDVSRDPITGIPGIMLTGYLCKSANRYYLDIDGKMMTGWVLPGDGYIYFARKTASNGCPEGSLVSGWLKDDGEWYYFDEEGRMVTGWRKVNGKWYYLDTVSGIMQTGWYCLDGNDNMLFGEDQKTGTWYYSESSGAMAFSKWIGNYYLTGNGAMAVSCWVGSYYVGADGKWIPDITEGAQWVQSDGKWYYQIKDGNYVKSHWLKINGVWYYFDPDGAMATGWRYIGNYKYYFKNSGALAEDLDGILPRQSSYYITVNRVTCQVMVYAPDGNKGYIIPVKTFRCSVGLPATPSPVGTFRTSEKYRWKLFDGPLYGQYATRINGPYLFHSVPSLTQDCYGISSYDFNALGSPRSHGCIRLCVRDAKWIYDNCPSGTLVTLGDNLPAPFSKPTLPVMPGGSNFDPTDPGVRR